MHIELNPLRPATARCPWCHDAARTGVRACARCGASQHEACWADGRTCASCGGPPAARPRAPWRLGPLGVRRRVERRLAWPGVVALCGLVGRVSLWLAPAASVIVGRALLLEREVHLIGGPGTVALLTLCAPFALAAAAEVDHALCSWRRLGLSRAAGRARDGASVTRGGA